MAAPSFVFTLGRVAEMLGEDENLLRDLALEMEPEDGCLTVLGPMTCPLRHLRRTASNI